MLNIFTKLKQAGVLGINERNRRYIMPFNPRVLYRFVDNKVLTKQRAQEFGITVPELYGVIKSVGEARNFTKFVENRKDFVIKPSHGSGGKGVLVIEDRLSTMFITSGGAVLNEEGIRHHISNVLGGTYSLGGHPDQAIIEYRVLIDPIFNALSYHGVPDIRMLVYKGIPSMAMLRLPTTQSGGKANLHQGAVGVGVNLATGITGMAVHHNRQIELHPDFGTRLDGLEIPGWQELLYLCARCYELAPLGYLGVDLVLDANKGPMVLELNARPGLAIQIANGCGLVTRFDKIDKLPKLPESIEERVDFAKSLVSVPV